MVTGVDATTAVVLTVKVAVVLAAGTVTVEGTLAAALLLESVTCAPPAGAGPLSVTVPVDDCVPPVTLVGFNVSEETVGRGRCEEQRAEVQSATSWDAVMVAGVDAATALVRNVKVRVVLSFPTRRSSGLLAAALLLESVTCAPPAGAGPLSVTVPVDDCVPPVTLVGFNVSEETVGRGADITGSVIVVPLLTCECEMDGARAEARRVGLV